VSTQVIRLTTTAPLLAHVAYVLGFTPTNSLAVTSLRGPKSRVGLVARVDLDDVAQCAHELARVLNNDGAQRVVVVTYTDDRAAARAATDTLFEALEPGQWSQAWQVATTGYRALYEGERLHPLEEIATNDYALGKIVRGNVLATSPAELLPQPVSPEKHQEAIAAGERWATGERTAAQHFALWDHAAATGEALTAARCGELGVALSLKTVRDAVLVAMIPNCPIQVAAQVAANKADSHVISQAMKVIVGTSEGREPGESADTHVAILAQVIVHTRGDADAVAAWTLWALVRSGGAGTAYAPAPPCPSPWTSTPPTGSRT